MAAQRSLSRWLAGLTILCAALTAKAELSGEVISILDGDTLEVLVDKTPVRIRLADIDAPEKQQPFGARARQKLAQLTFRQRVLVEDSGQDQYGRTLGTVIVNGTNANKAMIEAGMAWAYRRYLRDETLLTAEAQARSNRTGLWADPAPVAPWEWRAIQRAGRGQ